VKIAALLASGSDPTPIAHQDDVAKKIGGNR